MLPTPPLIASTRIARRMPPNVPPHNLREICDATAGLIDNPEITTEELLNYVQGPDFPTGGIIVGSEGIKAPYGTAHGPIIARARRAFEESTARDKQIVIEPTPYHVH